MIDNIKPIIQVRSRRRIKQIPVRSVGWMETDYDFRAVVVKVGELYESYDCDEAEDMTRMIADWGPDYDLAPEQHNHEALYKCLQRVVKPIVQDDGTCMSCFCTSGGADLITCGLKGCPNGYNDGDPPEWIECLKGPGPREYLVWWTYFANFPDEGPVKCIAMSPREAIDEGPFSFYANERADARGIHWYVFEIGGTLVHKGDRASAPIGNGFTKHED